MPTPDEELDQLFASDGASAPAAKSPDEELDELFASDAEPAKASKVIEMPVQRIEGEVPAPGKPKPWYSRFVPNGEAALHGAAAGATLNFGEEGASALTSALSNAPSIVKKGLAAVGMPETKDPEGFTREYKAGSQYADMRNTLEDENNKLREENPGSFIAGEMLGSAPLAMATGSAVSNVATPVLRGSLGLGKAAAGAVEASNVGGLLGGVAGAGHDVENRERGLLEGSAAGTLTGGALHGMGSGLNKTAKNAFDRSNQLITQTFMTPAQRAVYQQQHGLDSLRELGSNARDAGLFKGWTLPRAATVAKNANKVMSESGGKITGFEDDLAKQGINPDVNVRPIVEELRGGAADYNSTPALGAEGLAKPLAEQADLLAQPESVSVPGKVERPPALPEWSLNHPKVPKYGAAIEPVQESLPGTEYQHAPAERPLPPPVQPEQMTLPTPRAMPSKQLAMDTTPAAPARPEPVQFQMDLPRQQPAQQTALPLEPQQAPLKLPPAEARKNLRPEMTFDALPAPKLPSGGAAQEPMFMGTEPAKPPAAPAAAPTPEQLPMDLPEPQLPLDLDLTRRPNRFAPTERPAQQMNLPVQQELPLPARPAAPAPAPAPEPTVQTDPLAGKQEALGPSDVMNPNRGAQPELSTPLPDATAKIEREALPFTDAAKLKRLLGKQINWGDNPRTQQSQADLGTDTARKLTWKGISQQIDQALKGDQRIDPAKLNEYNKAKKDFSTAATAFDPSVKMMERQNEVGLGARDLMAGAAFGAGNPVVGGLSSMVHKTGSGMVPALGSAALRGYGHTANGLAPLLRGAAKVSPIAVARESMPDAPEAKVKQEANKQVKKDLDILLRNRETPK